MTTNRLEAFSDGVLAIIITIMVLELPKPHGFTFSDFFADSGVPLLAYLISFIYVGIYWNNHHHVFQTAERVSGLVLWANLGLLFALSLIPFTTAWMNESGLSADTVSAYGINLLGAALMFLFLESALLRCHAPDSALVRAISSTWKEKISLALYISGTLLALFDFALPARVGTVLAVVCFVAVAGIWLIPDRRFETTSQTI